MTEQLSFATDKQIEHLIMSLLDLRPNQLSERVALLLNLGKRYTMLAQASEALSSGNQATLDLVEKRQSWYREAANCLISALTQNQDPEMHQQIIAELGTAIIGVGQTLIAFYNVLLVTWSPLLHFSQSEQQTFLGLSWRALTFLAQGQAAAANGEFERLSTLIHPYEKQ